MCTNGDPKYELRLKASDMTSINDILTEVCHKKISVPNEIFRPT